MIKIVEPFDEEYILTHLITVKRELEDMAKDDLTQLETRLLALLQRTLESTD